MITESKAWGAYAKHYKKLLIIPFALLLIALVILFHSQATTGSFIEKGISLKGGTSFTLLSEEVSISTVEAALPYAGEINIRTLSAQGAQLGLVVEVDTTDTEEVKQIQDALTGLGVTDITTETIGSALGESFFKETIRAMIFAFLFMGVVVFIYFRSFIPSLAVILAAVSDILITMAITNLLGIRISTAGIAAFLMLIGYSVDTDILLSTKVLKNKEGTLEQRIWTAMKTGLMMVITTIIAVSIALFFSQSPTITQIMTIVLIGLIVDLINTWIQNVGLLRWHLR